MENKLHQLQQKIKEEQELIESYEDEINDLEDEISDYENDYDYESDPDGNDYDLNFVYELRSDIDILYDKIRRCEIEIERYEEEIDKNK